jgi:cytochrome c-type biogenesis protein CcmF
LVSFNPARYGGYIVHLGVALMMVGFAGSSVFKIELDPITVKKGETIPLGEYTLRFEGLARPSELDDNLKDSMAAQVSVVDAQGNMVTHPDRPLRPRIDFFKQAAANNTESMAGQEEQTARRPSIRSTPANDIYLVLDGFDTKDGSASIKAYLNPLVMWIWIATGFFVFGTVIAMIPARRGSQSTPSSTKEVERERELVA